MNFQEYRQYDALGLADLVKKKEVTAEELLSIAISRLEEINPKINAVIYTMYEEARKMAKSVNPEDVFAGVPFLFKDLGIHVAGHPLKAGSRSYQYQISKEDSELTKRLRKTGLVFLGKTNTPELGLNPYTEPELFGATLNPWNTAYTSGGSSGGSASSISAGIVPIATANDGGGSTRIPASCCGLFGLKTTRNRISLGSSYGDLWAGAVVESCISRSVRDTAAYLDALQGPGVGELFIIRDPKMPYLESIKQPVGKLTIAYSTEHPFGGKVDGECIKAVEKTVELLTGLGHTVVETPLPYTKDDLIKIFVTVFLGEIAGDLKEIEQFLGRQPKIGKDIELNTWLLGAMGKSFNAQEYVIQRRSWNEVARKIGDFHQKYDLLLNPTLALLPIKTGALKNTKQESNMLNFVKNFGLLNVMKNRIIEKMATKSFSYIPYTPIANLTGQPSMSVPLHWTPEGLPVGVQFTARICEEDLLLQLATQLEKASPWFDKVPAI